MRGRPGGASSPWQRTQRSDSGAGATLRVSLRVRITADPGRISRSSGATAWKPASSRRPPAGLVHSHPPNHPAHSPPSFRPQLAGQETRENFPDAQKSSLLSPAPQAPGARTGSPAVSPGSPPAGFFRRVCSLFLVHLCLPDWTPSSEQTQALTAPWPALLGSRCAGLGDRAAPAPGSTWVCLTQPHF